MALAEAIRWAVQSTPGSVRALAREAGVSHTLVLRICSGEREATPPVAAALAEALEWWAAACTLAARRLRRAAEGKRRAR